MLRYTLRIITTVDARVGSTSSNDDICYLQSQNGNLYSGDDFIGQGLQSFSEFEPLRSDVPSGIAFCTEALGVLYLATRKSIVTNFS